eukprot:TRINITY_DN24401_c0_g1_i1.p1 TRINITY_DN24401_c0_g1~~TRINITY_DN24401_c0_g1_i1.p1  ORF type:complete len:387 (+),score=84.22 TRINITY_DN24401_c0_g1_i1:100-1260(+)
MSGLVHTTQVSPDESPLNFASMISDDLPEKSRDAGAAKSRSTSAGSCSRQTTSAHQSPPSVCAETGVAAEEGAPMYLAPLLVRNTFLHATTDRPGSLEGFFAERAVRSCPVTMDEAELAQMLEGLRQPPGLGGGSRDHKVAVPSQSHPPCWPATMEEEELSSWVAQTSSGTPSTATPFASPPGSWPATMEDAGEFAALLGEGMVFPGKLDLAGLTPLPPLPAAPPPPTQLAAPLGGIRASATGGLHSKAAAAAAAVASESPAAEALLGPGQSSSSSVAVLCLADALEACAEEAVPLQPPSVFALPNLPPLGSPELPTMGSAGHHIGQCKPCAFVFTKGCSTGVQCNYCHLCPPGEKKRRQKGKKADIRQGRQDETSLAVMMEGWYA